MPTLFTQSFDVQLPYALQTDFLQLLPLNKMLCTTVHVLVPVLADTLSCTAIPLFVPTRW